MSHAVHKAWLKVTAVIVAGFAPVLFLGTMEATDEMGRLALDFLKWPLDGQEQIEGPTMRFLSAVSGGFLLGWGVMIWRLSGAAYDAAPEAVRQAVVTGILAWFVLDSAGSVTAGATSNVIFNAIILLAAVGPMWRPARG